MGRVWRADRPAERYRLDPDLDEAVDEHALADPSLTAPHTVSLGEPNLVLADICEPTRTAWRAELAALGGRSPLLHFEDSPYTRIELTSTHPGGLARFIAGKRTRLSSLIREPFAWRTAAVAAEAIAAKGVEIATARGLDAVRDAALAEEACDRLVAEARSEVGRRGLGRAGHAEDHMARVERRADRHRDRAEAGMSPFDSVAATPATVTKVLGISAFFHDAAAALAARMSPTAVYVGLALAVCAGSSLFLTAATSGPMAQIMTERAGLRDPQGRTISFGFFQFMPTGLLAFAVILAVGVGYAMLLVAA